MKYLSIKPVAWIVAMLSTSLSAQTVPDESIDQAIPFTITKVKYQTEEENFDKTFSSGSLYGLSITASGSTAVYHNTDYTYSGSGCFYFNSGTNNMLDTNIHLPDGHKILSMWYYYKDGNSANSTAYLMRMDGLGNMTPLITNSSIGDAGTYDGSGVSIIGHIIDNSKYFYNLRFRANGTGPNQQICGATLVIDPTP